jgi:hypothetical protein
MSRCRLMSNNVHLLVDKVSNFVYTTWHVFCRLGQTAESTHILWNAGIITYVCTLYTNWGSKGTHHGQTSAQTETRPRCTMLIAALSEQPTLKEHEPYSKAILTIRAPVTPNQWQSRHTYSRLTHVTSFISLTTSQHHANQRHGAAIWC